MQLHNEIEDSLLAKISSFTLASSQLRSITVSQMRGYLGLGLQLVAVEGGARGVMVMRVEPEGPGAKAGVHQGDIIVTWNGESD